METYVVIAQPKEIELVKRFGLTDYPIIITGVGGMNVISALKELPRDSRIFNVGYCGTNDYEIGDVCEIGFVHTFNENCLVDEWDYELEAPKDTIFRSYDIKRGVECYTSTDFVTSARNTFGVFDMELAFIRAMFDNVTAIKVVSDKLNYEEYKKNVEG